MFNITNSGNATQNHNEISPHTHPLEWLLLKTITSVGEEMQKGELSYTVGGSVS